MSVNLFGVRYGRSPDVDWFENPHEAVARCEQISSRKIIWLCYTPDFVNPRHESKAWQVIHNLADFKRRSLGGFAPADSPVWRTAPEVIPAHKRPGAIKESK